MSRSDSPKKSADEIFVIPTDTLPEHFSLSPALSKPQECLLFQKTYQPHETTEVDDQIKIKQVFQNGLVNYDIAENSEVFIVKKYQTETSDPEGNKSPSGHPERMHQFIQSLPEAYRDTVGDEAIERWIMGVIGNTTLQAWEDTFGGTVVSEKYRFYTDNKPKITIGFDPTLGDEGSLYAATTMESGTICFGKGIDVSVASAYAQIICVAELQDKKLSTKVNAYLNYDVPEEKKQDNTQQSPSTKSDDRNFFQQMLMTAASYLSYNTTDEGNDKQNIKPEVSLKDRVKEDLKNIRQFRVQAQDYNALRQSQKWQAAMIHGNPRYVFGYEKDQPKHHIWKIGLQPEQVHGLILDVLEKERKSGGIHFLRLTQLDAKQDEISLNFYEAAERYIAQECDKDPSVLFHLGVTALPDYSIWYDAYKLLAASSTETELFPELETFNREFKAYKEKAFSVNVDERKKLLTNLETAFEGGKKIIARLPAHLNFAKFEESIKQEWSYLKRKESLPKHEIIPTEIKDKPAVYKTTPADEMRRKIWQKAKAAGQAHKLTPEQVENAAGAFKELLEANGVKESVEQYLRKVLSLEGKTDLLEFEVLSDREGEKEQQRAYQKLSSSEKQDVFDAYLVRLVIKVLQECHEKECDEENKLLINDYTHAWGVIASLIEGDEADYTHTAQWDKEVKNPLCKMYKGDADRKMKRYSHGKFSPIFAQKLIEAEKKLREALGKNQNAFVSWIKKNSDSPSDAYDGNYTRFLSAAMYEEQGYISTFQKEVLGKLELAANEGEVEQIVEKYFRALRVPNDIIIQQKPNHKIYVDSDNIEFFGRYYKNAELALLSEIKKEANSEQLKDKVLLTDDGLWRRIQEIDKKNDFLTPGVSEEFKKFKIRLTQRLIAAKNTRLEELFEKAMKDELGKYEKDLSNQQSYDDVNQLQAQDTFGKTYNEFKKIYGEEINKIKATAAVVPELTANLKDLEQKLRELETVYEQTELKKANFGEQRIKALRQQFNQEWAAYLNKALEQNIFENVKPSKEEKTDFSVKAFAKQSGHLISSNKLEKVKPRMLRRLGATEDQQPTIPASNNPDQNSVLQIEQNNQFEQPELKDPIQQSVLNNLKKKCKLSYEAMQHNRKTLPQDIKDAANSYQAVLKAETLAKEYLNKKFGNTRDISYLQDDYERIPVAYKRNQKVLNAYEILNLAKNLREGHKARSNFLEDYSNTWNEVAKLCDRNDKGAWYHIGNTWRKCVTEKLMGTLSELGDDAVSQLKANGREPRIQVVTQKISEEQEKNLMSLSSNVRYYLEVTGEQEKVYELVFCNRDSKENIISRLPLTEDKHKVLFDYFEKNHAIENFVTTEPMILATAYNIVKSIAKSENGYFLPEVKNTLPRISSRFAALHDFGDLRYYKSDKPMLSSKLAEKNHIDEMQLITAHNEVTSFADPEPKISRSFSLNAHHYLDEVFIDGVIEMMAANSEKEVNDILENYHEKLKKVSEQKHILNKTGQHYEAAKKGDHFYVVLLTLMRRARAEEFGILHKISKAENSEEVVELLRERGLVDKKEHIDSRKIIDEKSKILFPDTGMEGDPLRYYSHAEQQDIKKHIKRVEKGLGTTISRNLETACDQKLQKLFELLQQKLLDQSYEALNYPQVKEEFKNACNTIKTFAPSVQKEFLLKAKQELINKLTKKKQAHIKQLKRDLKDKILFKIEKVKLEAEKLSNPNISASITTPVANDLADKLMDALDVIYDDKNQELVDYQTLESIQKESMRKLKLLTPTLSESNSGANQMDLAKNLVEEEMFKLFEKMFSGQIQQQTDTVKTSFILDARQYLMLAEMFKAILLKLTIENPSEKCKKIDEIISKSSLKAGSITMFVPAEKESTSLSVSQISRVDSANTNSDSEDSNENLYSAAQFRLFNSSILKPIRDQLSQSSSVSDPTMSQKLQ